MKPAQEDEGRPTELGRHFAEALRCLNGTDLPGANAALKNVRTEASLARDAIDPAGHKGGAAPGSRPDGKRARGSGVRAWVTC